MITNLEELAAEVVDDPAAYDAGLRAGDNSGPTTSIEGGLVSYVAAINREFVRQFARQIAGLDTGDWLIGQRHIGIGPLSIRGQERQSYGTQESFIEGNSGWKLSPLDASPDPASHFLGWAALGYQYGDGAVAALRITESPTNAGNTTAFTQQDIDSGLAAIALGKALRGGDLSVYEFISAVDAATADPSNAGMPPGLVPWDPAPIYEPGWREQLSGFMDSF